jgi:hypothetical protein
MSDTNDGRAQERPDPTAPWSEPPADPPATDAPLASPSPPATSPDAGSAPWDADLTPQHPSAPAGSPSEQPYGQEQYGQQPYAPQYPEQQTYAQQYPDHQQHPGSAPSPYAPSPYAPAPYAAPGTHGQPPRTNRNALVLTVISAITTVSCCLLTAPALILGIVALTRQSTDPESSARMTRYGWIAFAVAAALGVVAAGFFLLLGLGTFEGSTNFGTL